MEGVTQKEIVTFVTVTWGSQGTEEASLRHDDGWLVEWSRDLDLAIKINEC